MVKSKILKVPLHRLVIVKANHRDNHLDQGASMITLFSNHQKIIPNAWDQIN